MDSEKFDKVVLDLLYDELDELTRASAVRHMEQSGRAKALYAELRATREVGALPLVEPPPDLAARILAAEERVRAGRPLPQRIGAVVSIVAGYAMRPQLAMAALLLLMVGSSLLLLRVKPGEPNQVLVTERGVPESDRESVSVPLGRAAEPPTAAPAKEEQRTARAEPQRERPGRESATLATSPHGDGLSAGARGFPEKEESVARRTRGAGAGESGARAAAPAGKAAAAPAEGLELGFPENDAMREERKAGGCAGDLAHYQAIAANPPSPEAGHEATWAVAQCNEKLGRFGLAREGYRSLLGVAGYADRARAALDALPEPVAAAKSAPTPPAAPAASGSGDERPAGAPPPPGTE